MSSKARKTDSQGKPQPAQPQGQGQQTVLPSLGALDEDDEFEEFQEQDWPESSTDLSHLAPSSSSGGDVVSNIKGQGVGLTMGSTNINASVAGGGASSANGDHLWQDSWDDDTVEDDFSKALRAELEKQDGAQAMST